MFLLSSFISSPSVQLHRPREMSEDGDAALRQRRRHASQEPGGPRMVGQVKTLDFPQKIKMNFSTFEFRMKDCHQAEVLQRLPQEDGGHHGVQL